MRARGGVGLGGVLTVLMMWRSSAVRHGASLCAASEARRTGLPAATADYVAMRQKSSAGVGGVRGERRE